MRGVDGGVVWGPAVGVWFPRTEQKSSAQEASLLQQDPPSPHLYILLYKKQRRGAVGEGATGGGGLSWTLRGVARRLLRLLLGTDLGHRKKKIVKVF